MARTKTFRVWDRKLEMHVDQAPGAYIHRCPVDDFEQIVLTVDERFAGGRVSITRLRGYHPDLSETSINVVLNFLADRGCIRRVGRVHRVPGTAIHAEAMCELTALEHNGPDDPAFYPGVAVQEEHHA